MRLLCHADSKHKIQLSIKKLHRLNWNFRGRRKLIFMKAMGIVNI